MALVPLACQCFGYALGQQADAWRVQVLINPEIVEMSDDSVAFEEGCLSFPRIFADVKVTASLTCC